MIYIDGLLLQTDVMQILQELKYQLAVNGTRLFSTIKDSNTDIMISCPMHKDGQERKPSCGVHKQSGLVHCFACGYSATISEMISNAFGYDDGGLFGRKWLKRTFTEISVEERGDILLGFDRHKNKAEETIEITDDDYDKYRCYHPYMFKRGLTEDIIERYDIGYDSKTDDIIFPCHDIFGNISYTIRRSVREKRYSYPNGTRKSPYGIYEFYRDFVDATELIVCESIFNALSVVSLGFPAVALNGTGSKEQIEVLANLPVRSLVLALDPDDAGRAGTERIAKQLNGRKILYKLVYDDTRDLNDLYIDGCLGHTLNNRVFV